MTAISKVKLSGSTQGRGIKVVATASPGTTIHTTGASATVLDEVWLFAYNSDTVAATLTIEWGGTTAPDDNIERTIPPGLVPVVSGLILSGTGGAGLTVAAFAGAANKIVLFGYVNRIG